MRSISLLGLFVLAAVSAQAQRFDSAAVARQLDSVYARMTTAYQRADAGMVTALYDARAFYLPPGAPILRGRDEIHRQFTRILGNQPLPAATRTGITFEIVSRAVASDIAFDIGLFRLGSTEPAGKFTVLWRRGADGAWRIWSDQYNDYRAAAPAAPPAAPPAMPPAGTHNIADLAGEYRVVYPGVFGSRKVQVQLDAGRLTLHGMAGEPAVLQPSGPDEFRVIDPAGPQGLVMRFHRSAGRVVSASLGSNDMAKPGPTFFFLR